MREYKVGLKECVAPRKGVEVPQWSDELVHATEYEVSALAHEHHLHAVFLGHDGGLVYLRLDGVYGRVLGCHDDGSVLAVVVEVDTDQVVLQSQAAAVLFGPLHIVVEDTGV